MSILTFGSTKEKPQSCDIIEVGVHTKEGSPILLRLLSVPLICSRVSAVPVEFCRETYGYLSPLDFADVSNGNESELLIGSDYYWTMGRLWKPSSSSDEITMGFVRPNYLK